MNTQARLSMDKHSFLRWTEGRQSRCELKGNVVMMMVGGTRLHAIITSDLMTALRARLDRAAWWVTTEGLAVEIDDDIRYPDVLVESASGEYLALSTKKPTLIAEVMSTSSAAIDLNIKAAEYMSLASLEAYIVAAQDEPRLWIWARGTDAERTWPKVPLEFFGKDQSVPVPFFKFELPMAEIYAALAS